MMARWWVIPAREHRLHDLPHNVNCEIAHVVVGVSEPQFNGAFAHRRQHLEIVAAILYGPLEWLEVNRGHLPTENRVTLTSHLTREGGKLIHRGARVRHMTRHSAVAQGGDQ